MRNKIARHIVFLLNILLFVLLLIITNCVLLMVSRVMKHKIKVIVVQMNVVDFIWNMNVLVSMVSVVRKKDIVMDSMNLSSLAMFIFLMIRYPDRK